MRQRFYLFVNRIARRIAVISAQRALDRHEADATPDDAGWS